VSGATKGPWRVRSRQVAGVVVDCFVAADSHQGYAYDSEILGDDEYGRDTCGMDRRLADCHLISAAHEMQAALIVARDIITSLLGVPFAE
jgi:hypothetical protein